MKQSVACAGFLAIAQEVAATSMGDTMGGFLSEQQDSVANPFAVTAYGKSKCPCVGIDQMSGYYGTNLDYYYIQYSLDTGTHCSTWDLDTHPLCKGGGGPDWCLQSWCYVDPCNCETEQLPGMTMTDVTFQGKPGFWSYETCGFLNLYSKSMSKKACVSQEDEKSCVAQEACDWDGKRCGGKELFEACGAHWDAENYGQQDCACVGLSGREAGVAYLNINDNERIRYPPDVGAYCHAWELEGHPDCLKEGEKPAWCLSKWCFVDPCKCKTSSPARIVMAANRGLKYQGKTAYWSSQTCGNEDSWTIAHSTEYCVSQQSEEDCAKNDRCAWTGKECLGKALAGICQKQQETGILGFDQPIHSATATMTPLAFVLPMMFAASIFFYA